MRLLCVLFVFCICSRLTAQVPGGTKEQKDSIQVAREIVSLAESKQKLEERMKLLEASQENKISLLAKVRQKEKATDSSLLELKNNILQMEAETTKTKKLKQNIEASKKLAGEIESRLPVLKKEIEMIEDDIIKSKELMAKARSLLSRLITEIDELQKKIY